MAAQTLRKWTFIVFTLWACAAAAQPEPAGDEVRTKGIEQEWFREGNKEVGDLLDEGRYEEALQKNTALLDRAKQKFGAESFDAAVLLSTNGHIYSGWNKLDEAARAYEQSLALMEKLFGPVHGQVAIMQANLARVYSNQRRTPEAKALFEKAMAVAEKASGAESETVRQVLNLYTVFTANYVDKALAQKQSERLIQVTRKTLGPNSTELINAYVTKGQILAAQKQWPQLDDYVRDSVDKAVAEHGEQNTFVIQLLADFAKIYAGVERNQAAETLYRRIVDLAAKTLGEDHRFTVANYVLLANVLQLRAAHDDAIAFYAKAIALWDKAFGDTNHRIHDVYNSYGLSLRQRSRFEEAEKAFRAAMTISEKVLGDLHRYNVQPQINLAGLYQELGRYHEAEALYKTSLDISRKIARNADDFQVALVLDNMGVLYGKMGQPDEAEKYSTQSLEMFERIGGLNSRDVVLVLNNLSAIFSATGRSTEALNYTRRALQIVSERREMANDSIVGILLDNLAGIYSSRGDRQAAEEYHTKAYEFFVRVYGKDNPDVGIAAQNLGMINFELGDYRKAESWHRQALDIFARVYGKQNRHYAGSLRAIGSVVHKLGDNAQALALLDEALRIDLEVLPPDHPDLVSILVDKGDVHIAVGEFQAAYDDFKQAAEIIIRRQDDAQMRLFRQRALQGLIRTSDKLEDTGGDRQHFLTTAFSAAQRLGNSNTSSALAQMSVRFAGGNDALAQVVRDQQDLTQQLASIEAKLTNALGVYADKRDEKLIDYLRGHRSQLSEELAKLNDEVQAKFPAYAELSRPQPMSVADLQAQLRQDELFIQYVITEEGSYVWIVGRGVASWRRLAISEAEIREHVTALRCGLEDGGWSSEAGTPPCEKIFGGPPQDTLLPFDLARAHQLYAAIIGPFEKEIAGKHLLIVPSGALTSIPFQVLLTKAPGRQFASDTRSYAAQSWLAKSNAITILPAASSLKALRQFARESTSTAPYVGYGDPKLAGNPQCGKISVPDSCDTPADKPTMASQAVATLQTFFRSGQADTIAVSSLCPLPDTAHELECVAQSLGAGPETIHTGLDATEPLLKAASARGELEHYRIVHFATHGLLAGETQQVNQSLAEPALVLTPPAEPSREDDGLLTASEVAQLRLNADWVVLSACNTAGGDRPGAEALSGLARAFFYAGARALLVSHWPVDSAAAVKLTTGAFAAMRQDAKIGRGEAMRRSITALIDRGKSWEAHPSYWAPFVVVGEGGAAR
jgi:CHAT domain-containing protein/tetratricopeptide (TPR) repeat protein